MPTYEYECDNCGYKFELFQSITARPVRKCQKCSGKVRRLIGTGAGIIFKGNGFYATDYRSKSYKEAEKKETSPQESKKEKTDVKSAVKSDVKSEKEK